MLLHCISVLISCRILIDKVLKLSQMSERATWKKILENEEDKGKIAENFKQIDEHTKNFYVRLPTYLSARHIDAGFLSSNLSSRLIEIWVIYSTQQLYVLCEF